MKHGYDYLKVARDIRLYSIAIFIFAQTIICAAVLFICMVALQYNVTIAIILSIATLVTLETIVGIYTSNICFSPLAIICSVLTTRYGASDNYGNAYTISPNIKLPTIVRPELIRLSDSLRNDIAPQLTEQHQSRNGTSSEVGSNILSSLPVGIIALNNALAITYANEYAPVSGVNDSQTIQLDFSSVSTSLYDWIINMQSTQLTGQNHWSHISNVSSASTEDRRIYDIVASYNREAKHGANIIVLTIDRTDDYIKAESTMDMLTLAAHELRGPITTMRGYIDLLEDKMAKNKLHSDSDTKLIESIDVSSQRLSSYVNNVLNTSRYEHKNLHFSPQKITIYEILKDVREDLSLRAKTSQRNLVWEIKSNLPSIFADRNSIDEVISNLVDNAIKYSPVNDDITISAQIDSDFLAISVRDHGIGIPQSSMAHIFDKFYRGYHSNKAIGGSGLGLYISRAIVKQHGGYISVESVEGSGTTFTFWIPLYKAGLDSSDVGGVMQKPDSIVTNATLCNHNKVVL